MCLAVGGVGDRGAAVSCAGIDGYSQLDQSSRAGVDLVVQQLHAHVGVHAHFLFFRSVEKSDIEVIQILF